jgi:hypothetical protein
LIQYRDIQQKRQKELFLKQDKQAQFRAVIVDELGNQSGSGDIWANRAQRRVWIMPIGGVQAYQVLCVKIANPSIGLGVIVGYADPLSRTQEVLRTDYEFFQPSSTTGRSWEALGLEDLQVGGELRLWLDPRLMIPLATYPDDTGLVVNVVSGDYVYAGVRVTFAGQVGIALTQNPNPGEHYLAGLYLDASNTLQVIYGASIAIASTAPQPAWPDGAFQLSTVLIDDTQTSISLADDITNRRILWTDIDSFSSWPFASIWSISTTDPDADFVSIAAAIASGLLGFRDGLVLDAEQFSSASATTLSVLGITITGGMGQPEITSSISNDFTLKITNAGVILRYMQVAHTAAGTLAGCITSNQDGSVYDHVRTVKTSGAATTAAGIWIFGGNSSGHILQDCDVSVAAGTAKYGVLIDTAASTVVIEGGQFSAVTADIRVNHASATVILKGPQLKGGGLSVAAGTVKGWYFDANGNEIFVNGSGMSGGVWLEDASTELRTHYASTSLAAAFAAALAAAAAGDVITCGPGTYTVTADIAVSVAITIKGFLGQTVFATSTNNVAIFNLTAAAMLDDLIINNSGAGAAATGVRWNVDGVVLRNLTITTSGAPLQNSGLDQQGGVGAKVYNPTITVSGGTGNYGYINQIADGACEIYGGQISGSTYDVYPSRAGSVLATYGTILVHNTVNNSGTYPRSNIMPTPTPPILMNGHPLVWQRGTSFAAAATGQYFADRFSYHKTGSVAVHTLSRDTSVPSVAQIGSLFEYSMLIDCTTVDASIAAGDAVFIRTVLEGYDFLKIAQQQFTIPMWVAATKAGVYCIAFRNSGTDRSYVAEFTAAGSDAWGYFPVTVPASPSAGTWDYTTGAGLQITVALACGSTFQTTAGTWETGNFIATSNQVNGCDDIANNFRIIMGDPVPGPYARPMLPNPYGTIQELTAACQRYAYLLSPSSNAMDLGFGRKSSTTNVSIIIPLPTMRVAPTALAQNISGYTAGAPGTTTIGLVDQTTNAFFTITGALTVAFGAANTNNVRIDFAAGTSWSGTAGDIASLRIGPSVVAVVTAEY